MAVIWRWKHQFSSVQLLNCTRLETSWTAACQASLSTTNSQTSSPVQLLCCVQLFATPWTVACQASLSITNYQSLLKLMSIKSVMPSNHLILSFPSPPALNLSQHLLQWVFSQGLFQWVSSLHQVAKVLEFQPEHQSFQWRVRTDFL